MDPDPISSFTETHLSDNQRLANPMNCRSQLNNIKQVLNRSPPDHQDLQAVAALLVAEV